MLLLIFLLIYVISVYGNYKYIQLLYYNPKGRNYGQDPYDFNAPIFLTFCPGFNTSSLLLHLFMGWKRRKPIKIDFRPKK
jgi:hypothetical protein